MRLLIATDAWAPQVNGVVKTLSATIDELRRRDVEVEVVQPGLFANAAMPGYREIRLAWPSPSFMRKIVARFQPDHVHISTEGPIGWAMRRICLQQGRVFTTSYHTRFPEYLRARLPVPMCLSYRALRTFHNAAQCIMVATPSIENELLERGFHNIRRWSRGVDLSGFTPDAARADVLPLPRPIFLSVGRISAEKNLDAFLSLALPGSKVVIGDGPDRQNLEKRYRDAVFLGAVNHAELPAFYASADVFVFPSRTDTFGLVLIEAMACGLPIAAFPVAGPIDVVDNGRTGVLSEDLRNAATLALQINRGECRRHAETFTWTKAADQFLENIASSGVKHPFERVEAPGNLQA